MNKTNYLLVFALCFCSIIRAQKQVDFLKQNSFYVNGDATIIGNNSVSKHETKAYNDFSLINDQIKMTYVDIDTDGSTFSSSSATLNILDKNATVKSATLYWCAMYPYGNGIKKGSLTEIRYQGNGTRDSDIDQVKFKMPNGKYQDIKGTVLFDGFKTKDHKDSSPYVCYADVTNSVKNNSSLNGTYTVANVKATQGFMTGGSAAGWFLYIVYESPEASSKYISSYHGFSAISDNDVDVNFSDFKTKETGIVDASIFVATLEGDSKLSRDVCSIYNAKYDRYVILKNKLRSAKNFFNSKITNNNTYVEERHPNSTNTLGFDLLQLKLPKGVLSNNQSESKLRLGTKADRFFLFFTAFKTEISEVFHINKEAVDLVAENKIKAKNSTLDTIETPKALIEDDIEDVEAVKNEETPVVSLEEIKSKVNLVTLHIPGVKKGYYLVTNVFSKPYYAKKWRAFLNSKSHTPESFINPKNNWDYIYIYNDIDLQKAYKEQQKLVKHDYFKEIWIYKINMD